VVIAVAIEDVLGKLDDVFSISSEVISKLVVGIISVVIIVNAEIDGSVIWLADESSVNEESSIVTCVVDKVIDIDSDGSIISSDDVVAVAAIIDDSLGEMGVIVSMFAGDIFTIIDDIMKGVLMLFQVMLLF
jgi:hypothetical protein